MGRAGGAAGRRALLGREVGRLLCRGVLLLPDLPLLQFLGLLRYRNSRQPLLRHAAAGELQSSLAGAERAGLLDPLAYHARHLDSRLSIHADVQAGGRALAEASGGRGVDLLYTGLSR